MPWQFEQSAGRFVDPAGIEAAIVYSGGECGLRPDAVNNPDFENIEDVGPLPRGNYVADWMNTRHPKLGYYVIHLAPDAETAAKIASYGRDPDSFFCHGDDIAKPGERAGSDGCLVIDLAARQEFWESDDHGLQVI